jgi:zinc protease
MMKTTEFKLDRSKPPVTGKPKDVKFPKYFEKEYSNGIKLYVINDSRFPLVTSRFVFKNGASSDIFENNNKSGLASIVSELITKGTNSCSATEIAEKIDNNGAVLSSGCDYDATYITSSSLKKFFPQIFNLTSELIRDSVFSEEELEREKLQVLNSILSCYDDGEFLSERVFKKKVYGESSYSNNIEGVLSSVKNIGRNDVINFYKNFYTADNLLIALVGDITSEEAEGFVTEKFANWNSRKISTDSFVEIGLSKKTKTYIYDRKSAVQSNIRLGHIGISRNNPDFIPASVMNTLFGGYFTSRINKNLREVNGYTYGARSYFAWKKKQGDFSVETDVRNDLTSKAVKEIIFELKKLKDEFATESELDCVKNYLSGNFPLQLETPNAIATKILNLDLYELEKDFYDTYVSNIFEVTVEDIKQCAEKYVHPDNIVIAIAGNSDEIANEMKDFGEVEILNEIE